MRSGPGLTGGLTVTRGIGVHPELGLAGWQPHQGGCLPQGAITLERRTSETGPSLRAVRQRAPSTRSEQATSTRFWVRREDTSAVQHHIMQHLPVAPIRPVRHISPLSASSGPGISAEAYREQP